MSIERKILTKASFEKLVLLIKEEGKKVFAPVLKGTVVDFAEISSLQEMTTDYIVTRQSAKSFAFPKAEKLFSFHIEKGGVLLGDKDFNSIPEIVLIGARPCDAAGFNSLSAIFNWDTNDALYSTRLNQTTIIGISCNKSDAKCFCTSVKGSPGNTIGSDILLTMIDNGDYLAEIISDKGKAIVTNHSSLFETAPEVDKEKYLANVPVAFDIDVILNGIVDSFDKPIWKEQSLRCLGCGACAFVCPTCACFDIQDINVGNNYSRKRSWDSCGFSLFTLHTSAHNPRELQSQRWRQRVMHKFAYMPDRQQVIGCVGCGRCSRACSVDMNLKEHLINLQKEIEK